MTVTYTLRLTDYDGHKTTLAGGYNRHTAAEHAFDLYYADTSAMVHTIEVIDPNGEMVSMYGPMDWIEDAVSNSIKGG